MKQPRHRILRGFSLIELLAVIAIIALLLSLLLPALLRARAAGQRVACLSALRQLALASQTYFSDSREWYLPIKQGFNPNPLPPWTPPPPGLTPPTVPHLAWYNMPIFRSLVNLPNGSRVPYEMVCSKARLAVDFPRNDGYDIWRSYAMNTEGLGWYNHPPTYFMAFSRRTVKQPTSKLMFIDATDWVTSMSGSAKWDLYGEVWDYPPKTGITSYRHENGANVLFFDGHGAYMHKRDIINNAKLWRVTREK